MRRSSASLPSPSQVLLETTEDICGWDAQLQGHTGDLSLSLMCNAQHEYQVECESTNFDGSPVNRSVLWHETSLVRCEACIDLLDLTQKAHYFP